MSWDCDVCGGGRDDNHQICILVDELREIKELLKQILNKEGDDKSKYESIEAAKFKLWNKEVRDHDNP